MALISTIELLQYTQNDVDNVRKYFEMNEKTIQQRIEILKEWLKQQQHLPQVADDGFLERMLLRNKFRLEQTKTKLDDYYTLRGLYPDYILQNCNDIVPSKEIGQLLPLPKLTKSHERILYSYKTTDPMDMLHFMAYMSTIMELITYNDYSIGDRFVLNYENMALSDMAGFTLPRLANYYKLYTRAYSGRIISVDIINLPPHAAILVSLLKMVLPQKLHSRITVHNNLDSFHKMIPKEYLPADLGGELETIDELTKKLDGIYIKHRDFFNEIGKNISNERLRIGDLPNSELYGIDGNFKKLDID